MKQFTWVLITITVYLTSARLSGQETSYGPGSQTMLMNNPALTGSAVEGTLRLSYLNFFPGNGYNFHSVYVSGDSYFPLLHGGAGFHVSNDYLGGILNDLRGGLSYSYFLQAGRELYIYAGLSATLFSRGYNFSDALLPEQIDQLGRITIPPSEFPDRQRRFLFDAGTGFLVIYKGFIGGLGITHLTEPDLAGSGSSADRMKRKYFLSLSADLHPERADVILFRPVAALELQGSYFSACMGTVAEYNLLSVNSLIFFSNSRSVDLQAGFSLKKDWFTIHYNYKFSLKSGNSLLPFSLLHQAGLSFSLNNVKKSVRIRTINIPAM